MKHYGSIVRLAAIWLVFLLLIYAVGRGRRWWL